MNPLPLSKPASVSCLALLASFLACVPAAAPQDPVAMPPPAGLGIPVVPVTGIQTAPQATPPATPPPGTSTTPPAASPVPPKTASPAPQPAGVPAAATAPATPSADSSSGAKPVVELLSSLSKFDQEGRESAHKIGFELPEASVNDYIAYVLRTNPRPGVRKMRVSLMARNQIAFEAEVDFTAIAQWLSWTPPDALKSMLTGTQTVRLNLEFEARDGAVTLKWKDAFGPGNQPVPSPILTTVLQSLGAHQPEGFDTTKPIPLPYGLKRIWTEKQLLGGEN